MPTLNKKDITKQIMELNNLINLRFTVKDQIDPIIIILNRSHGNT